MGELTASENTAEHTTGEVLCGVGLDFAEGQLALLFEGSHCCEVRSLEDGLTTGLRLRTRRGETNRRSWLWQWHFEA